MLAEPSKKNIPYTRTAGFILAAIPAVGLSLALCPSNASADTTSDASTSTAPTSTSATATPGASAATASSTDSSATSSTATPGTRTSTTSDTSASATPTDASASGGSTASTKPSATSADSASDASGAVANTTSGSAIANLYNQLGGASSKLGAVVSPEATLGGGSYQQFANGRIYWSEAGGAHVVAGGIGDTYISLSGSVGALGYPTGDSTQVSGGYYQQFANGRIYWSNTDGASVTTGAIDATYSALSGPVGKLGFPLGNEIALNGGSYQQFANGRIYSSQAGGTHAVAGGIGDAYIMANDSAGELGFPTGDSTLSGDTYTQRFQNGRITWSNADGPQVVLGSPASDAIDATYEALGGASGKLGVATTDETDLAGGAYQAFDKGRIYWTEADGAHATMGAIGDLYVSMNGSAGKLGFPTGDSTVIPTADGDAYYQQFQKGRIYFTPGNGTHATMGAIGELYVVMNGSAGKLGLPTGDSTLVPTADGDAYYQQFQKGRIYFTPGNGTHATMGAIGEAYVASGGADGKLGLPIGDSTQVGDYWVQQFQHGWIYCTPGNGTRIVAGGIGDTYNALGGAGSFLGLPIGDSAAVSGGWFQQFQGGRVYWSATGGGHAVHGAVLNEYIAQNGSAGILGVPVLDETPLNGGTYQQFANGRIYWKSDTGARTVHGAVLNEYINQNGSGGVLAFPNGNEVGINNGVSQDFERGRVYWRPNTYAYTVHGAILATYLSRGASDGALGFPTSNETPSGDGVVQNFQNGTIAWTQSGGTVVHVNGSSSGGSAPAPGDETGYIKWVAGFAQEEQRKYGVPAAVSIAQSIIESGWGQSGLTLVDHNYFGIKCPAYGSPYVSGCTSYSTSEYENGGYVTIQAGFRSYNSAADSFLDHGYFLSLGDPTNSANRYYPAFLTTNDQDFVRAIANAGYATDPTYASKIISIMDRYNLYQYDV
ncbi:Large surface protein A [Propionibacterium freudenreichii]|nr:Large surface protein A [Propionibacterium freudenreichii]